MKDALLDHAMFGDMMGKQDGLPWLPLETPAYTELTDGVRWTIKKLGRLPLVRGYFLGLQPMREENWILLRDEEIWMSLTPMELESQAPHLLAARGHTVIMGFGLGVLTYNVLQNENVDRVTVIEIENEVVDLIDDSADMLSWPNIGKLELVYEDALDWTPDGSVDVVLADIWPNLGSENLRPDMQQIYKNVKPKVIAGWGMELDYIDWMHENGKEPGDESLETYVAYAKDIGLPLIEQDNPEYPKWALEAAKNVIMY